ncbi:MAG: multidrug transporter [Lachnospiraceae bacterium]|nr:multidrug transporter [Lachnospiraceae bacterium]
MEHQSVTITRPETFLVWTNFVRPDIHLDILDAEILLSYMEGHDYELILKGGDLYRHDIAEENGEMQLYGLDDVIDIVCEWNYELKCDAETGMQNPKSYLDYCQYKDAYDSLCEHGVRLDSMFEQTKYGKRNQEIVERIVARALGEVAIQETVAAMVQKEAVIAEPSHGYDVGGKVR